MTETRAHSTRQRRSFINDSLQSQTVVQQTTDVKLFYIFLFTVRF